MYASPTCIVFTVADWSGETYVYPRVGIAERLESELARLQARDVLEQAAIFMSSSTDPYQPAELSYQLTRQCLTALARRPPGLLVIQTRAPLAARDFDIVAGLGERCLLNMTVETDREDVRRSLTPHCPSIRQRLDTARTARDQGIPTQLTVSPCLPYSSVEAFGNLLLGACDRVVVDSFVAGDGSAGNRTARTGIPVFYARSGWEDWRSQESCAGPCMDWFRRAHRGTGRLVTRGFHAPGPPGDRRFPLTVFSNRLGEVSEMKTAFGGIEAGGTKFVCAVGTGPDDIRAEIRLPTEAPDITMGQVIDFFRAQQEQHDIAAIGVASFGPVDPDPDSDTFGHITNTPKPGWANTPVAPTLRDAFDVPVGFDTDVNVAALGEHRWGAAQSVDTFVYLTIGTGIGGGGMVDGNLLHGLIHPEMGPHRAAPQLGTGSLRRHLSVSRRLLGRTGQRARARRTLGPAWGIAASWP